MYDASGRLLGKPRTTGLTSSIPGLWTMQQQIEAKRALLWPPSAGEDPYFANVSLLLRGDGTNGSMTILDESFSPKTVTAYGDAQISTAQSKYGGSSIAFDGSGDYLAIPNSADFNFESSDFTIEFWAYTSVASSQTFVAKYASGNFGWYFGVGFNLGFYFNSGLALPLSSIATNQWVHLAVTRSGSSFRLFVDGTQSGSTFTSSTSNTVTTNEVRVAADGAGNPLFAGYIDDLRITKGVARYTSNFTPPDAL